MRNIGDVHLANFPDYFLIFMKKRHYLKKVVV